jgi:azurin
VKFIVSKTPQTYYHYGASGQSVAAAAPKAAPAAAPAAAVATTMAATAPADATGTPSALKVIQTIKADQDKALLVDLNEAKVRGATLSVVVTLRHTGSKPSAWVLLNDKKSGVMSYDTGETAETIKLDDQVNSAMKPGEVRTVRAVFKVPKGAKKVSITLGGVGTFDDVELQ